MDRDDLEVFFETRLEQVVLVGSAGMVVRQANGYKSCGGDEKDAE